MDRVMMKGYSRLLLGTVLMFSMPAAFATNYIQCDSCSYIQMENAAIAHGVGRYVVGNVNANAVYAFHVYTGPAPQIGSVRAPTPDVATHAYADDGNITGPEISAFASLYRLYHAVPVGYQKHYTLQIVPASTPLTARMTYAPYAAFAKAVRPMDQPSPGTAKVHYPDTGEDVYTFINGGPAQNALLDWVGNTAALEINSTMSNLVKSSMLHALAGDAPAVYVTVVFVDGSHIGVYVDLTQQPPALKVNPASAVDSHGNSVPASLAAVTGAGKQIYNYNGDGNPTDLPHMTSQIGSFGIAVPGPTVTYWACQNTTTGPHCVQVQ